MCSEEWTLVSPNKKRTDRAMAALQSRPSKSILKRSDAIKQVKRHLSFATFEKYEACLGYELPFSKDDAEMALAAGYDCPQIRRRVRVSLPQSLLSVKCDSLTPVLFGSIDPLSQPWDKKTSDQVCISTTAESSK
jgi:hypothetical protein